MPAIICLYTKQSPEYGITANWRDTVHKQLRLLPLPSTVTEQQRYYHPINPKFYQRVTSYEVTVNNISLIYLVLKLKLYHCIVTVL